MRGPIKLGCERRRGREADEEREIEVRAVENRDLDAHRQAISCYQGFVAKLSPNVLFFQNVVLGL